jgi:protein-S-isoprenylcysteine O-methyltransferase Ste14
MVGFVASLFSFSLSFAVKVPAHINKTNFMIHWLERSFLFVFLILLIALVLVHFRHERTSNATELKEKDIRYGKNGSPREIQHLD